MRLIEISSAVRVSAIRACVRSPASTHRRFGICVDQAADDAFASGSLPQTSTSLSIGTLEVLQRLARDRVERRRSNVRPVQDRALACSAAEPCHGRTTCHARPPTAVASGLVQSHDDLAVGFTWSLIAR